MNILRDQTQEPPKKKINRLARYLLLFVGIIILGCISFYFVIVPNTTGQFCLDFLSGHIPPTAQKIFLEEVFSEIATQDYEQLSTINGMNNTLLARMKEIQPSVTEKFEVVGGDSFGSSYERIIQFENDSRVYISFLGTWSCPDFVVTNDEVFQRIQLTNIMKQEP
jgi:hypothetical protein